MRFTKSERKSEGYRELYDNMGDSEQRGQNRENEYYDRISREVSRELEEYYGEEN